MEQVETILNHHMIYLMFGRFISRDPNMFVCIHKRKISTTYDSFDITMLISCDRLSLHEDHLFLFFLYIESSINLLLLFYYNRRLLDSFLLTNFGVEFL